MPALRHTVDWFIEKLKLRNLDDDSFEKFSFFP